MYLCSPSRKFVTFCVFFLINITPFSLDPIETILGIIN